MKLLIICLAVFAANTLGQPLLTVCEVMAHVERYADKSIAVVGQMERSVSIIDHSEFLSQDRCEHPLVRRGHRFADKIGVWTNSTEGMPDPPASRLRLEPSLVAAKVSMVRKTTSLRSHDEPTFRREGNSTVFNGTRSVKNEWAVAYGRVVKNPRLDENCGIGGCGGDDVPLTIVVKPYNVYLAGDDGVLRPATDR